MSTPFLWEPGTGNNGLYASTLTLMTTELESLGNGSGIISSVNGTSGKFTNSNTAQVIWGVLSYSAGNAGMTPTAGGNMSGWFLQSVDGSVFEQSSVVPPRPPDFIIPLPASAITTASFGSAGLVRIPALEFYVYVQNNSGVTTGAGATTAPFLKMAPVAVQY